MALPFSTEEYYQKVIQLQEKLRQSEEERLKLEMQFNEMVQVMKEEEEHHFKRLRTKYKQFLEEDRRRQQRNDKILDALEKIENRAQVWKAKSEKFKEFKKRYGLQSHPSFDEREIKDNYPAVRKSATDYYTKNTSIKPSETPHRPYETKYSNLGNINSVYLTDPKDAEKCDEKQSSENSFSKSTKNLENSLKQNKPQLHVNYDYLEDDNLTRNETPITTTLEVHNRLQRLLNDSTVHIGNSSEGEPAYKRPLPNSNAPISYVTKNFTPSSISGKCAPSDLVSSEFTNQDVIKPSSKLQYSTDNNNLVSQKVFEPTSLESNLGEDPQILLKENVIESKAVAAKTEDQEFVKDFDRLPKLNVKDGIDDAYALPTETVTDNVKTLSEETNEVYSVSPTTRQHSNDDESTVAATLPHVSKEPESEEPAITKRKESVTDVINQKVEEGDQQLERKLSKEAVNNEQPSETGNQELTLGDESPIKEDHVKGDEDRHYDQNREQLNPSESDQIVQQFDGNEQPLSYDQNGDHLQQYDKDGQPLQCYPNDTDAQYYNETGEYAQYDEQGQMLQYDQDGQLLQQYDEDGKPIQHYYNDALQYDENGQPILQYDENGQPLLQYDENGQPIVQYDQNGQPLAQYDENGQPISHYDEHGQNVGSYDDNEQMAQYDENGQLINYGAEGQAYVDYNAVPQQYAENDIQQPEQPAEQNIEPVLKTQGDSLPQENNAENLQGEEEQQSVPSSTPNKE